MSSTISFLQPTTQQFLDSVNQIAQNMQEAQEQVSSGLKITKDSDDPDQISQLLQTRAQLDSVQQTVNNLNSVTTEVTTAEQALQSAVTIFTNVQSLGAEGATSTATPSQLNDLSQQVGDALNELVGLTTTQVAGRYIFSGNSDQVQPYTIDLTQADPVSAYQGSASTRMIADPNGFTFPVALTAQQIFDSSDPTTNVFTLVNNLRNALSGGNTQSIQSALSALSPAADYLNQELAFYGTTQDHLNDATTLGQQMTTNLQTQIANIQDADLTSSILELTQAQTQEQAAMQSEAQVPRSTLFDYLSFPSS